MILSCLKAELSCEERAVGLDTILRLQELLISIREGREGCWASCNLELLLLLPANQTWHPSPQPSIMVRPRAAGL